MKLIHLVRECFASPVRSVVAVGICAAAFASPCAAQQDSSTTKPLSISAVAIRAIMDEAGELTQPIDVTLRNNGADTDAVVRIQDGPTTSVRVLTGKHSIELHDRAVTAETTRTVLVEIDHDTMTSCAVLLKPVPRLTVYILPHSHTDIGYTEIQTAIEKKQVNNLLQGIECAQKTASYPKGARFVWNVEVLWAADLYLKRLGESDRAKFLEAVKSGQVSLNGMYLNELTGLCRPEELIQLFRYATKLGEQCGTTIDSAMMSDVPGYTWGTVTAMSQAGIRYFSTAPNYFDRIGDILSVWENKPFYWVGPDGHSKVLVWIPFRGYAMSHIYKNMSPKLVDDLCNDFEKRGYPYDIAHVRWSGHGDNAVPDPTICDFVRDWNAKYAWPKFVISSTSEAFHAFEQRYGDKLPLIRGDWTPYWEDGAGSSAFETAMNRASSDRLTQAETLFAMLGRKAYSPAAFEEAWNRVLLYSEHTWGAHCSVTEPERSETKEQWDIKRGYAVQADQQSHALLAAALKLQDERVESSRRTAGNASPSNSPVPGSIDVFNTLSWPRTELVVVPADLSRTGDRVSDSRGRAVVSQRLASGELVFVADSVPPFAAQRYTISHGASHSKGQATANGTVLDNGLVRVRVDERTGGIAELTAKGAEGNYVDASNGEKLNDYLYLIGDDPKDLQHTSNVLIRTGEKGPLVASLIVESSAPGCRRLVREIRITAGFPQVELINTVDKERLSAKDYKARSGKESVNFAFPFHVPGGSMLLDLPLGAAQPELDQMPSACKNWFTIGRWADVSNKRRGITWVTADAPLVQIGGITATLLNSQKDPAVWRKHVDPTQKLYSWAMNNHWGTNYRAYQEGPVVFRFAVRPHGRRDEAEASRFASGYSQPLLPVPAGQDHADNKSLLTVEPASVLVSALKPSDDGKGLIVRLFGASDQVQNAKILWRGVKPKAVYLSDTSEKRGAAASGPIAVLSRGLVTLRAELE